MESPGGMSRSEQSGSRWLASANQSPELYGPRQWKEQATDDQGDLGRSWRTLVESIFLSLNQSAKIRGSH